MADQNPYRSPDCSSERAEQASERGDKRGRWGCLAMLLLAKPLLDTFGVLMSLAGEHSPFVFAVASGGFAAGAVLGAYVSARFLREPWWSSCRWAIYGLLGMCLLGTVAFSLATL